MSKCNNNMHFMAFAHARMNLAHTCVCDRVMGCVSIRYSITCKGTHNIIRCILQCWRFVNTRDSLKISGLMLTEYVIPAAHHGNP